MPTVVTTASIGARTTNWQDTLYVPQIDPALSIQSLTLAVSGTLNSTVTVANLDGAAATVSGYDQGTVTLKLPSGSPLFAATSVQFSQLVQPGQSNLATLTGSNTGTASASYRPGKGASLDANSLIGTGTVALPVAASARVHATGPGNMLALFSSQIAATASITADVSGTSPVAGTDFAGTDTININSLNFSVPYAHTAMQTVSIAAGTTGTSTAFTINPFDPSLGHLADVKITTTPLAAGIASLENLDPEASDATVAVSAGLAVQTTSGTALASQNLTASTHASLGAADGTADFAGPSAATLAETFTAGAGTNTTQLSAADAAAFTLGTPVTLTALRTGTTTVDGPGNLMLGTQLQTAGSITVTYDYYAGDLQRYDTTTRANIAESADTYAGPVANLQKQYIWSGTNGTSIQATTPNMFLKGGACNDDLTVTSGSNVLDGGAGYNLLGGGSGADGGHDTFFVDARGSASTWSDIENFHAGDMAAIFGFTAGVSTYTTTTEAASPSNVGGYTGFTIHAATAGAGTQVNASMTFAGIDQPTANAHFVYTTGTLPGSTSYLLIQYI